MKPGDIVLVRFPFTNLETTKKRPCLVLGSVSYSKTLQLVTVAMITSNIESLQLKGDIVMGDWKKARLLHPSLIRLSKVATIEGELIEKKMGLLSSLDLKAVKKQFVNLFSDWL